MRLFREGNTTLSHNARTNHASGRIGVVPFSELTAEQLTTWNEIQSAESNLDSPFFRAEFTHVVDQIRGGVEVAVVEEDGREVAFFPFERRWGHVGYPVGCGMSDFHGMIIRPGYTVDLRQLLRSCGLTAWHFNHLARRSSAFEPYEWAVRNSPHIDSSTGFEAYCANRNDAGVKAVKQSFQKLRKLEREVGCAHFEINTFDPSVLKSLMAWKSTQCHRTLVIDYFSISWIDRLFRRLMEFNDKALCGMVSALRVGHELLAATYCMRSNGVLHLWATAYNPAFARYSPGYQVLLKLIEAAPSLGVTRIDLGTGPERFKQSLMTGSVPVSEGAVDRVPGAHRMRRLWRSTRHLVRETALRDATRTPWRLFCLLRDQHVYR